MLYMIGAVEIQVWPFNAHDVSQSDEADFAEKAILGRRQPSEAVGEGAGTLKLSGRLFPQKFGGLDEAEVMDAQRQAQRAVPVMRGDGVPLGWYVITQFDRKSSRLDAQGVGRVIEIEVSLRKTDGGGLVGAGAVAAMLSQLLG
jgi:phage protein U